MAADSTIHASAVLAGPKAVLIRGPSGSGKSLLAWNLINAASQGLLTFTRLVGDDRVQVIAQSDQLLVRPAPELSGLIEIHGLGIRRLPFESIAMVGWSISLRRMPPGFLQPKPQPPGSPGSQSRDSPSHQEWPSCRWCWPR